MQIMQRELSMEADAIQKRLQGSEFVAEKRADALKPDVLPAADEGASANPAERYAELASELRLDLDARGMREVGSGELGIVGTRPAGVYSAASFRFFQVQVA